jgi:hypothetical protein
MGALVGLMLVWAYPAGASERSAETCYWINLDGIEGVIDSIASFRL